VIYLIQYDRQSGTLVRLECYASAHKHQAEQERLRVELELLRTKIAHEVVLLEATSEDELRKTQRRYFEGLEQLLEPAPVTAL
jgi:hypothetical protein